MNKISYKEYLGRRDERKRLFRFAHAAIWLISIILLVFDGYNHNKLVSSYIFLFSFLYLIICFCFIKIAELTDEADKRKIEHDKQ